MPLGHISFSLPLALVKYTSITCISNIPLFILPSFLSAKYVGAVPLPVTISFAVEALSFRLGSSFGLLHRSGNLLAILLEVPFISLALLLETSGLVNHQHMMLFLDFYLHRFQHREELWELFPLSLAYYSSS
mgnify:CR=1 FL=1